MYKKDMETNQVILEEKASYVIRNVETNELVTKKMWDITSGYVDYGTLENPFTTSNKGYLITPMELEVGKYILEEISKKNDYDLIIDFHRDSISRDLSVLTYDSKNYAKVMFVVGKGSPNYEKVKKMSKTLSSMLNDKIPELSRGIYEKTSHYNQGLGDNMVLIEVGASKNTYEEVTNTLNILTLVIDEYLNV